MVDVNQSSEKKNLKDQLLSRSATLNISINQKLTQGKLISFLNLFYAKNFMREFMNYHTSILNLMYTL